MLSSFRQGDNAPPMGLTSYKRSVREQKRHSKMSCLWAFKLRTLCFEWAVGQQVSDWERFKMEELLYTFLWTSDKNDQNIFKGVFYKFKVKFKTATAKLSASVKLKWFYGYNRQVRNTFKLTLRWLKSGFWWWQSKKLCVVYRKQFIR